MKISIKSGAALLAVFAVFAGLVSGCVIAPRDGYREGYYDRDHHRYYHERAWHDCSERDEHCR